MNSITLENFDDAWNLGDPALVENELNKLLPQAKSRKDNKSIYLQILSQIALAQAIQKKFNAAHKTLDEAETLLLTSEDDLALVRILLERGRILQQEELQCDSPNFNSEKIQKAINLYKQSFELSKKHGFDYHTINAAHMLAIAIPHVKDKIKWNKIALDLALQTEDKRAGLWLAPLYNNLGQNYLEFKELDNALSMFRKALEYRKKEGYASNIRIAKWSIAHVLRMLGHLDEALYMQQELLKEYDEIARSKEIDMPLEMFKLTRGWVYEELAQIYNAKAQIFAKQAYDELSQDTMFNKTESRRLEALKKIL